MNLSVMIWNPNPPVPWFGQFYAPPSDSTASLLTSSTWAARNLGALTMDGGRGRLTMSELMRPLLNRYMVV